MNAEEMTDVVFNALKLPANEWDMEFDDYNAQVIHITNNDGDTFKLTITKE